MGARAGIGRAVSVVQLVDTANPPDIKAAARFLEHIAEGEPVTFQTYSETAAALDRRARHNAARRARGESGEVDPLACVMHGTLDECAVRLCRLHAQGAAVFFTVNYTDGGGRTKDHVTGIRAGFVDTDGAPLPPIMAAPVPPHIVVETSPGKYHVYWTVTGCSLEKFEPLQKALAAKYGTDPSVCDLPRVLRLPGFDHRKADPFRVTIKVLEPVQPVALDELVSRLGLNLSPAPKINAKAAAVGAVARIDAGQSLHETVGALIASMVKHGMPRELVEAAALGLVERARPARGARVDAFIASGELQRLIDGAVRKYAPVEAAEAEVVPSFEGWPDGDIGSMLVEPPPPRGWLADSRLLAGRGHLLVGIGGASKTRLLYHLGAGAVTGRLPWGWAIKATGSAALFLAEDVIGDVHHALHALAATLSDEERRMLTERLRVFPLAGLNPRLLALNGQALRLTAAYGWVMEQLDRLPRPLAFVGLDPVLGLTEGDELNPAHQRRIGELVDRIGIESGACAMATAHAAKSIQQADELGSHSARGSGAITDAVRGEFTLRGMTADEARRFGIQDIAERKQYVQLAATKGNHLPPEAFAPLWLRRGFGGSLAGVTLEQVERGSVGQRESAALDLLRQASLIDGLPMRQWRDLCVKAGVIAAGSGQEAQDKAMQRIRSALQHAGLAAPGPARGTWVGT